MKGFKMCFSSAYINIYLCKQGAGRTVRGRGKGGELTLSPAFN